MASHSFRAGEAACAVVYCLQLIMRTADTAAQTIVIATPFASATFGAGSFRLGYAFTAGFYYRWRARTPGAGRIP